MRNKNLLQKVEEAFEGLAETRKRILIEWANEIWREVENTAFLLEHKTDYAQILKEQTKLSEDILEYMLIDSHKIKKYTSSDTNTTILSCARRLIIRLYRKHRFYSGRISMPILWGLCQNHRNFTTKLPSFFANT